VPVEITHAGPNIVEIEAAPLEGELTPLNNRAALTIEGIREKLRVLLVSGEPHAGERTWRNLLKSDANVDLVHFTILRPPEKQDGTPINELSLIAFPTRELFQQKIKEFDLIIFDRYANSRACCPSSISTISCAMCAKAARSSSRPAPNTPATLRSTARRSTRSCPPSPPATLPRARIAPASPNRASAIR
jgi:hypothetical protein